jgi:hypothetical protein
MKLRPVPPTGSVLGLKKIRIPNKPTHNTQGVLVCAGAYHSIAVFGLFPPLCLSRDRGRVFNSNRPRPAKSSIKNDTAGPKARVTSKMRWPLQRSNMIKVIQVKYRDTATGRSKTLNLEKASMEEADMELQNLLAKANEVPSGVQINVKKSKQDELEQFFDEIEAFEKFNKEDK